VGVIAGSTCKLQGPQFRIPGFIGAVTSNLFVEVSNPAAHLLLNGMVHGLFLSVKYYFANIRLRRLHGQWMVINLDGISFSILTDNHLLFTVSQ
jgi:hypothetical protein